MKHLNFGAFCLAAVVFLSSEAAKAELGRASAEGTATLERDRIHAHGRRRDDAVERMAVADCALSRVQRPRNMFTCGGSLVAPDGCFRPPIASAKGAATIRRIGRLRRTSGRLTSVGLPPDAETRKVKRLVVHEGYDKNTQENDIALMELAEPLQEPVDRASIGAGSGRGVQSIGDGHRLGHDPLGRQQERQIRSCRRSSME